MALRGYDRDEYEDMDEYEEEYEEDQGEEEIGEDEHEEEVHQPTEQELEYLEFRERLKENIRKRMSKDSGSSVTNSREAKNKLRYDNYGSFFGPSQPVIAHRVIEESKSLLENPHLVERVSKSRHNDNKVYTSAPVGSKPRLNEHPAKPKAPSKIQMVKNTRDYSFLLSDDAEPPAPKKETQPPRNVLASRPEARSAQVPLKSKHSSSSNGKVVLNPRVESRAVPTSKQIQPKVAPHKVASAGKPVTSDYRKQHEINNGTGPGRPQVPKRQPSKVPMTSVEKKAIPPSSRDSMSAMRRSQPQPSIQKQTLDRRRDLQESGKEKLLPRQPVTSKPQMKKQPAKGPSPRFTSSQDRPKKKPVRQYSDDEGDDDGEGEEAIAMIRKMFGYNPRKYADDDDDKGMEANYKDILKEERLSAKIAREEDEEELRKIEEEERREQLRKAKKRKLNR